MQASLSAYTRKKQVFAYFGSLEIKLKKMSFSKIQRINNYIYQDDNFQNYNNCNNNKC